MFSLNLSSRGARYIQIGLLLSGAVVCFFFLTQTVWAGDIPTGEGFVAPDVSTLPQEVTESDIRVLTMQVVNYVLSFLGLLGVIVVVYGGLLMVSSRGDEEQFGKGKTAISYALIGIVVILMAYSLVNWVLNASGGPSVEQSTISVDYCLQDPNAPQCQGFDSNSNWVNYCDLNPEAAGCAVYVERRRDCDANPTSDRCQQAQWINYCDQNADALGCDLYTEVLGYCDVNPTVEQCSDRTWISFCQSNPTATGCPSDTEQLEVCAQDPALPQCQKFQWDSYCNSAPEAPGCSDYLLVDYCQANPQTPRCNVTAWSSYCSENSEGAGCSLENGTWTDQCNENPSYPQCNVSQWESYCDKNPTATGCPTNDTDWPATCNTNPQAAICQGDYYTQRQQYCVSNPTAAQCQGDIYSQRLQYCLTNPSATQCQGTVFSNYSYANSYSTSTATDLTDQSTTETSTIDVKITASPAKGPAPLTVVLDGRGSSDPSNRTIPDSNYHWSYKDTNGATKTLESKSILETTFEEPGKYVVELKINSAGSTTSGSETVEDGVAYVEVVVDPPESQIVMKINGELPIETYKVPLTKAKEGLSFDPSNSEPGIGKKFVKYKWNFGDNTIEAFDSPTPITHYYNKQNDYQVTLEVTDDSQESKRETILVKVQAVIAQIDIQPERGNTMTNFLFDADESYADEGEITEYKWEILNNNQTLLQSDKDRFEYQFDSPGEYTVRLQVIDSLGREDLSAETFTVESQAPIPFFSWQEINDHTPSTILFDSSGTLDRDSGDNLKYSWDFDGDGVLEAEETSEKMVSFKYSKVGKYDAKLVVTDSFGEKAEYKKQVTVNSILDVDFSPSKQATQINDEITFNVLSPNAVSYYWYFDDGTVEQTDQKSIKHFFKEKGVYRVSVTGFDQNDNETTVTKEIHIGTTDTPVAVIKALVNSQELKLQADICGKEKDGFVVNRSDAILLDAALSINIDGTTSGLEYYWDFGDDLYSTDKKSQHSYKELSEEDECNEVILVVKDRLTGTSDQSNILYFKVVNKLPILNRFKIDTPQEEELLTPLEVPVEIVGAQDSDGRIDRYKFWYYYLNSDEKQGVQVVSTPRTTLSIMPSGYEDQINQVYFGFEIIDNDGGSVNNSDQGIETIPLAVKNGPNMPPTLELSSDKTVIKTNDGITFFATATDPQGNSLPKSAFAWDFEGDGVFDDTTSGPQVTRVYNLPGEYEVIAKVSYQGLSTTKTHKVFVEKINAYPLAAFLFETSDLEVEFDASNSQVDSAVSDNKIYYSWDFDTLTDTDGDGETDNDEDATTKNPTYTYDKSGKYNVQLTISDNLNTKDTVTHAIIVGGDGTENTELSSLKITSTNQPLTTLDVVIQNGYLKVGDNVVIEALVLNADSTPFNGVVRFEVLEGSGEFSPAAVNAIQSKAKTLFKAETKGRILLQVIAENAIYGSLTEEIAIEAR